MLGFGALGQFPLGGGPFGTTTVTTIGWFAPLSTPQRFRIGLAAREQQFLAFQPMPSPFVATGWFSPLSTPSRKLPRNPAALAPWFFFDPAPSPFVATGWFMPLGEPQLQRRGLKAAEQPFFFYQPGPSPFVATGWFAPLSMPQLQRRGLKAAAQQFLASPSRILPTPDITGTMAANESGDIFLGGARMFATPFSGEAGTFELRFPRADRGVTVIQPNPVSVGIAPPPQLESDGSFELPPYKASVGIRQL